MQTSRPSKLRAQRLLGRQPRAQPVQRLRAPLVPGGPGGRDDPDAERPQRQVVLGLERGRGGLHLARVGAQQRRDELLLVAAAQELGVGVRADERGRLGRRGAREPQLGVAHRRLLEQPQVAEPAPAADQRHADARPHPDVRARGDVHRPRGRADALVEERHPGLVGREPAEDAGRPHVIELAELGAVRQRPQFGVVDQDRAAQAEAQRVDDLLETPVHRSLVHMTWTDLSR